MIKLLVIGLLIMVAIRALGGAWPWQWLSTDRAGGGPLARARRLLQVAPGASAEDIRAAYRRLAADMHPDRGGSTAHLAALTEARDLLLANLPETRR
ncbi:J domain-containing protein [Qipengyuania sediminis]|uniref:J domain-containing protein n=1 Tax=Qipengyuania sediminis TaxID=1532023 RepID=UPI001059B951|nr:J domain-containing protein [Qipengyuania sediminis]